MSTDRIAPATALLNTPEWAEVFDSMFDRQPICLGSSDGFSMDYDDVSTDRFSRTDVVAIVAMQSGKKRRRLVLQLNDGRFAFLTSEETSDGHDIYNETHCFVARELEKLLEHGLSEKDRKKLKL